MKPKAAPGPGYLLLGLAITFNPLVDVGTYLRLTDFAAIVCLGLLGWRLVKRRSLPRSRSLFAVLLGACIVAWVFADLRAGTDPRTAFRWITALIIALVAADAFTSHASVWLWAGLFIGASLSVLILGTQVPGEVDTWGPLVFTDPDASRVYVGKGEERAVGLYGHPNASAAVASIAVPAGIALSQRHAFRGMLVGIVVAAVAAGLAYTRSALIVSLLTCIIYGLMRKPVIVTAFALVIALAVLVVGPPGGWERWTDASELQANLDGRVDSMREGFAIVVAHPMTSGSDYGRHADHASTFAVHNAFLQAALFTGFAGFLVLAYPLVRSIGLARDAHPIGMLGFHLVGLFFFENHLSNVTFAILAFIVCIVTLDWTESPTSVPQIPRSNTA